MAARDLDPWLARGVPRERLVLGVPFYGYGFGGEKANWSYRELAAAHGLNATKADVTGERCAGCLYITQDRKSVVQGKSVSVRVARGGGRIIKKKNKKKTNRK